ncbi:Hpt domain-containing protein [Arthrobacter sp. H35-D1]|uniref:Hpt domain-containing protein n=1 Tax=Arthrobacter sp. H35-D1 TaxID=3046202 RepID=UPI0024BBAB47|nr:Hpt domain-containing protein [Arthrobacter sp. H35-D1]MDJ0313994.1 hypothetical protein [Arthrobacter sp. H35-D1]
MTHTKLPLVCNETLHSLEDSLFGERALCRNFVHRYVDMWPGRFERIQAALAAGNNENAMDAALSLRSSSMMVGAARLGDLTTNLIHLLEIGRHAAAAKKLTALLVCGNQTTCQLTMSYINVA